MRKCNSCGRLVMDDEYIEEQESGSGGYCYCEFSDGNRILHEMREVEWWEMLDWNGMRITWDLLSDGFRDKIRNAGLAPDYDVQSSKPKAKVNNDEG